MIFVMFRRTMLGAMRDPAAIILAVVLTALEEAILRSTMVFRDTLFHKWLSEPEMSDDELMYQRRKWAASR